ncbi:MAG: glutaredoxin family protein [Chloroflexi bacterium]|nr:MAG: glutaredoxin family protein [Chloroflexota bacterium]TME87358.1 MAG: glutaredoxin family protein [Chloroflexota bacterium]
MARPDCGLCDEAMTALRRLSRRTPLDIERVDVTRDAALLERYVVRVPVLVAGDAELDVAGIDDGAIGRWLDEVGD